MKQLPALVFLFSLCLVAVEGCKKNPCNTVSCNGGGTCENGTCQCDTLHEGTNCETEKRARYYRSSVGAINCTLHSHFDYVKITKMVESAYPIDSVNMVLIHNLYGGEQDVAGILQSDGSLFIPQQPSGTDTITGTASLLNNKLVVNFSVTYAGGTESCTWTEQW